MRLSLDGKVALVTGGATGLGRMIAEGLLAAGAHVVITSRKAAEIAAGAMAPLGKCDGINVDLGTSEGIDALRDGMSAISDRLHIIVNNAGRSWGAPIESFPDKAWGSVMTMNVQAPFAVVQRLLPALEKSASPADPARVINIGSAAGSAVERLDAYSYAASKAALHHLSREMAATLGPRHITVNTVVPGYFPTRMTAHIEADETKVDALIARIPLGRLGAAEDIAGVCTFLASPLAAYITAAEIAVDGGLTGCR